MDSRRTTFQEVRFKKKTKYLYKTIYVCQKVVIKTAAQVETKYAIHAFFTKSNIKCLTAIINIVVGGTKNKVECFKNKHFMTTIIISRLHTG